MRLWGGVHEITYVYFTRCNFQKKHADNTVVVVNRAFIYMNWGGTNYLEDIIVSNTVAYLSMKEEIL